MMRPGPKILSRDEARRRKKTKTKVRGEASRQKVKNLEVKLQQSKIMFFDAKLRFALLASPPDPNMAANHKYKL